MTTVAVTTDLLHHLVTGTHAEGISAIAVTATLDHDGATLLIVEPGQDFIDDTWQLPSSVVLPAQTLTDALAQTLAGIGLSIDEVTGYLGHHDEHDPDSATTRVFNFAVTVTDPSSICRSGRIRHWWAPAEDRDKLGLPPDPRLPPATRAAPHRPETTPPPIAAALPRGVFGPNPAEAGTELLIRHATWLHRNDFLHRYLRHDHDTADVDWPSAISDLNTGQLTSSRSEARILRLAASLANGIPVDLRDALTGLDSRNIDLVSQAVLHANDTPPTQTS
jgi:8-oxo-dGTP diphosphatase